MRYYALAFVFIHIGFGCSDAGVTSPAVPNADTVGQTDVEATVDTQSIDLSLPDTEEADMAPDGTDGNAADSGGSDESSG